MDSMNIFKWLWTTKPTYKFEVEEVQFQETYVPTGIYEKTVAEEKIVETLKPNMGGIKHNAQISDAMIRMANYEPFFETFGYMPPQSYVYMYNVSPMDYVLGNSVIKKLLVPACPYNKKYTLITKLPNPVVISVFNPDSESTDFTPINGKRVAMDLINPDNLGLDQNELWYGISAGGNYSKRGVFWSETFPPKKQEVQDAHYRLRMYYISLLEKIGVLERTMKPSDLFKEITPEHHAACEYLGLTVSQWHPVSRKTQKKILDKTQETTQ